MPNNCKNVIKIRCSDETFMKEIKRLLIKPVKNEKIEVLEFTMTKFMPRPKEQEENWHEWNCENWGTKWDCYYTEIQIDLPNVFQVFYETAWSPNGGFMAKLINEKLIGKVEFIEYYYYEFGMGFSGYYRYENGEEIQKHWSGEENSKHPNYEPYTFPYLDEMFTPLTEVEQKITDERMERIKREREDRIKNPDKYVTIIK